MNSYGLLGRTDKNALKNEINEIIKKLKEETAVGHNMIFIGRVGLFCPIKPGNDGGILYRVYENKNYAAPGSTGFRWLESDVVKTNGLENCIDKNYYDILVNDAIDAISKYGDYEWFISDSPEVDKLDIVTDELPF